MNKVEAFDMIKAIDAHGEGLTDWEKEFIASIVTGKQIGRAHV